MSSLVLHLGILVAFAWMPDRAHASSAPEKLVEIDFVQTPAEDLAPPPEEPEPTTPLPLGRLDASLNASPTAASIVPQHTEKTPASEAPEVLAVDNPYASSDATVFTSGKTAARPTPVVNRIAKSEASFGVESGSARPDADRAQELRKWYAKVQAQLARLGTRNYPRRALKLGQQGTAKITVTIDASGKLIAAQLAAGSGVASLDHAALAGVQSISKVAPPPSGSGTNRLTVPVTFRLN